MLNFRGGEATTFVALGKLWIVAFVAALAVDAAFPVPVSAQLASPTQPGAWSEDSMQPGDMVRLQLWRDPELNGDYPIDEYGIVTLPLIGPRSAVGIPADTLRRMLVDDLMDEVNNQDPVVTLLRRVRVLGEVQAPGLYHIDRTMTLGDVIALAEGAGQEGKLSDIKIFRGGAEIRSDLNTMTPVGEAVRSGDQIMVPKRAWLSRNGSWLTAGILSAAAIITGALIR